MGLVVVVLACALPARAHAVVGGANVPDGSAPYAVAILSGSSTAGDDWDRVFCGGTIVGPRTVLTAAHCARQIGPAGAEVLAGRTNLLDYERGTRAEVTAVAVHPGLDPTTFRDDAALLTLATPLPQAPIALAGPGQEALWSPGAAAAVLGWGHLAERQRSQTAWLQAGALPIAGDDTCSADQGWRFDPASQLCAGAPGAPVDACQGDSGGPLVVSDGTKLVQVGIVSSGRGCGRAAGVYTRVGAHAVADWISAQTTASATTLRAASDGTARAVAVRVRRLRGGRLEVRGAAPAGARVAIQRRARGRWITVARPAASAAGRFRATIRAARTPPRVRAVLR